MMAQLTDSNQGEIILYQSLDNKKSLEVRVEDETVWLTQAQMVELFSSTKQNISLHINNVFKEGELNSYATVKEYLTVQIEGERKVQRKIAYYNLDVIISVGYRVKSHRGTQFRIWATQVLKNYLLKGYALHNRLERVERKLLEHEITIEQFVNNTLPPNEGIFYDGQIFDAYQFVASLIKSAQSSVILIDNYIDESVLMLLAKRGNQVGATIYTQKLDARFKTDLEKFNRQYSPVRVKTFSCSHDRFLILDQTTVFHFGASLKDLGKKWFAFSKMEIPATDILSRLD